MQYLDGVATFEEVMYRTGLSRREVDRIAYVYRDHVSGRGWVPCTPANRHARATAGAIDPPLGDRVNNTVYVHPMHFQRGRR